VDHISLSIIGSWKIILTPLNLSTENRIWI